MLKIYGASDDLVEVDGPMPACDEYGDGVTVVVGEHDKTRLVVFVDFTQDGWKFSIHLDGAELDDDSAVLPWPINLTVSDQGYSPELQIDCPDDTRVEVLARR